MTFSIFSCFLHIQSAVFQAPHKAVILRACDFFDLFVFSSYPTGYISTPHKAVILSEALRRSIANRGLYSAESKDPGDACWQMLLGAFRPQTTTEDKKVTASERSASQNYRKQRALCAESKDRSGKRFAQDDGFAGVFDEKHPN